MKAQKWNLAWKIFIIIILFTTRVAFGLEVSSYYGRYDITGKQPWQPAKSLQGPEVETWEMPKPNKHYKIAALVPHLKDDYWLGVNYGLIDEAKKLGITLKIFSAGGYGKGGMQRQQLTADILKEKVSGVILGSVFYNRLDRFIAQIDKMGIPIVAVINDVLAPDISAKVTTSYYEVGYKIGEFVLQDAAGKDIKVAFFPGPKQAVWATDTFAGFMQAVRENPASQPAGKITIVAEQYANVTAKQQKRLIDRVLEIKSGVNYIVGNAIAAREATKAVSKYRDGHPEAKIISTYLLPDVYDLIKSRDIYASVADFNIAQARIALDMMVRLLNGDSPGEQGTKFPFRTAPVLKILTKEVLAEYDPEQLFSKQGFQPVYEFVLPETKKE